MAIREREVRGARDEAPIGDLLREISQDAATLVRQEIALAKAELKETVAGYARDAGRLAAAAAAAWFGIMTLLAAAIIGLGSWLDNYWASALLLAVVLLAAAALVGRAALQHMKRTPLKPEQTIDTLQEDQHWARRELRDFKQQIKH